MSNLAIKTQLKCRFPRLFYRLRRANSLIFGNLGYNWPINVMVSLANYVLFTLKNLNTNSDQIVDLPKAYDSWIIVGSGPSLNAVNFDKVKDCNVVLLNKAHELSKKFDNKNNNILAFFTDTHVYNLHHKKIQSGLKAYVAVTKVNFNLSAIKSILRAECKLFFPHGKLKIRSFTDRVAATKVTFGLFETIYERPTSDILTHPWYSRRTVMLSGIALAVRHGAKSIVTLGFDGGVPRLNPNDAGYYAADISVGASRKWKWSGWDEKTRAGIDIWSKRVNRICTDADIDLVNASPKTLLNSIRISLDHPLYKD